MVRSLSWRFRCIVFDRLEQAVGVPIGHFDFTPIENIFDDIREATGAVDVQIAVYYSFSSARAVVGS